MYALGVILFELLCGQRPYATRGLSAVQIEQQVLQREPARPSARASGRGETQIAAGHAAGDLRRVGMDNPLPPARRLISCTISTAGLVRCAVLPP